MKRKKAKHKNGEYPSQIRQHSYSIKHKTLEEELDSLFGKWSEQKRPFGSMR